MKIPPVSGLEDPALPRIRGIFSSDSSAYRKRRVRNGEAEMLLISGDCKRLIEEQLIIIYSRRLPMQGGITGMQLLILRRFIIGLYRFAWPSIYRLPHAAAALRTGSGARLWRSGEYIQDIPNCQIAASSIAGASIEVTAPPGDRRVGISFDETGRNISMTRRIFHVTTGRWHINGTEANNGSANCGLNSHQID